MSFQKDEFLKITNPRPFKSEEEMERYFIEKLPVLLRISAERIKNQGTTTSYDGTLSNICDVTVYSKEKERQAIIVFELKLDKSVRKHSSYEDAKKQVHKYCQDLNCPYGILLSEKKCHIFHYEYIDSDHHYTEIQYLPSMDDIEKEAFGIEEQIREIKRIGRKVESKLMELEGQKVAVDVAVKEGTESIRSEANAKMIEHEISALKGTKKYRVYVYLLLGIIILCTGIFFYYKRTVDLTCENIKGNISSNGDKIYHTKDSPNYDVVVVTKSKGEDMFCNEKEAIDAGFRRWVEYKGN